MELPCSIILLSVLKDPPPINPPREFRAHDPPGLPKADIVLGPTLLHRYGPLPVKIPWRLPSAKDLPQPTTNPVVPVQVSGSKLGSAHSEAGPLDIAGTLPAGVDTRKIVPHTGPQRRC